MKISYLKSITLLFILVLIASCEKDDSQIIENEEHQDSKYNSSITTLKELEGNEKLTNALDKILTQGSYKGRGTEIHGITVDSSMVKVIEMEGFKTYTMLMLSDDINRNIFSNLVIKTFNSSKTVEAYVFKYPQTQSMEYYEPGDSFTLTGGANIYTVDTGYPNQTYSQTCVTVTSTVCWHGKNGGTGPIHTAGPNCQTSEHMYTFTSENCFGVPDSYPGNEPPAGLRDLCFTPNCEGSGGAGSNYSGPPNGDSDLPTNPLLNNINIFFDDPSQELLAWWTFTTPESEILKQEIINFLRNNKEPGQILPTDEAQEFAKEVIKNPDAEVDFEDRVIIDPSFEDEPCFQNTLDQLSTNDIASDYFDNFTGENPVSHLKFTASSFGNNKNAVTHSPENFVIEIEFNTDKTSRPTADIARTIMHEVIHAEIFRKLLSLAQAGDLSGLTEQDIIDAKDDYPGIYDYYTRYIYDNPNPSSPQHNLMAQHMIDTIINFLMQFDNSLSYFEAEALAWTGLKAGINADSNSVINPQTGLVVDPITGADESTVAWTNLSQAQRLSINQTRSNYMQNTPPCQ